MIKEELIFAHLADLHIGAHRDNFLKEMNFHAIEETFKILKKEHLDFIIISGDIFNYFHIPIELLNKFITILKNFYANNIPIYVIGGSHDYSTRLETYLKLLDTIGYIKYIQNLTPIDKHNYILNPLINKELGLIITGLDGKKNQLDKEIYKNLHINTENFPKDYFKIFLFHTTINELVSDLDKNVGSGISLKYLPKNFDYYAGGHIHKNIIKKYNNFTIAYPGTIFPNNFSELTTEKPTFNLCHFNKKTKKLLVKKKTLKIYQKEYLEIELTGLTPIEAKNKILNQLTELNLNEKIILLKIKGTLEGKISDLRINEINNFIYDKGAKTILRNTRQLKSNLLDKNLNQIQNKNSENEVITDFYKELLNLNKIDKKSIIKEKKILKKLLRENFTKFPEEKNKDYEERIIQLFEKKILVKNTPLKKTK